MNAAVVRSMSILLIATGVVLCSLLLLVGPAAAFTYVGRAPIAGVIAMGASVVALLSGFAVAVLEPRWLSSALLAVVAALWVSPAWAGWQQISAWVATAVAAVALFAPAVIVHLSAGFASGPPTRLRVVVVVAYALGACAAITRVFASDPFTDVVCWADCRPNPLAVMSIPSGESTAAIVAAGSGAIALALVVSGRVRRQSVRRGPELTATVAMGLLAVGYTMQAAGIAVWHGDPVAPVPAASLIVLSAGLAALAIAHAVDARSVAARRRRLREVSASASPALLDSLLAAALRDPAVRIVYHVGENYIDASGSLVQPRVNEPDVRVTRVERGGEEVAAIVHSSDAGELGPEIGPALRVALENESLRVALDATLADLQASCARIVAAADARRRVLERDLHDGAQQELIALAWRLSMLARDLSRAGDAVGSRLLEDAAEHARAALDELREVSHGLHPAILTSDGVEGALRTLALTAPLAVTVAGSLPRLAPEAETALYSFGVSVAATLADAGSHRVELQLRVADGAAFVTANANETATAALDPIVADRLRALGGWLSPDGLSARVPLAAEALGVSTDRMADSRA